MSLPSNRAPQSHASVPAEVVGPDGAKLLGPMTLSGVVRTTKGFSVAVETIDKDGNRTVRLGISQTERQFVALEHRNMLGRLANTA